MVIANKFYSRTVVTWPTAKHQQGHWLPVPSIALLQGTLVPVPNGSYVLQMHSDRSAMMVYALNDVSIQHALLLSEREPASIIKMHHMMR